MLRVIKGRKEKLFLLNKEEKIRRRPRDKDEEKVLDILLNSRMEKCFKKGIIKKTGRRKFKLKI